MCFVRFRKGSFQSRSPLLNIINKWSKQRSVLSTSNNTYSWRIKHQSCVWKLCYHVSLWHQYSISCKLSFVTSLHFSRELSQMRPSTCRSQKGSDIQVSLMMAAIWSKPQLISITSPGNGTWKKKVMTSLFGERRGLAREKPLLPVYINW